MLTHRIKPFSIFTFFSSITLSFVLAGATFPGLRWLAVIAGITITAVGGYYALFKEPDPEMSAKTFNRLFANNLAIVAGLIFALFFGLALLEQFKILKIVTMGLLLILTIAILIYLNISGGSEDE